MGNATKENPMHRRMSPYGGMSKDTKTIAIGLGILAAGALAYVMWPKTAAAAPGPGPMSGKTWKRVSAVTSPGTYLFSINPPPGYTLDQLVNQLNTAPTDNSVQVTGSWSTVPPNAPADDPTNGRLQVQFNYDGSVPFDTGNYFTEPSADMRIWMLS